MASGGSDLNTSTSAEDQNRDNRQIYETALKNFKKYKVEISDVIQDTFPFLELLRDREFISNETYADCEDSSRNQVPVQRVVYSVLCELEKTFDLPLLEVIFSDVLKKTNPGLNRICEIFRNVIPDKTFFSDNAGEKREEWPDIQPNFEQGTVEKSLSWMYTNTWRDNGTTPPKSRLSELLCKAEKINTRRKNATSLESQQASEQRAQKSEPADSCEQVSIEVNNKGGRSETPRPLPCDEERAELPNHGIKLNSCSVLLVDIKKEKPFFNSEVERQSQASTKCHQASEIIVISSDESSESSDGDETPRTLKLRRPVRRRLYSSETSDAEKPRSPGALY